MVKDMVSRQIITAVLFCTVVGCSQLPDVDRAIALSKQGDYKQAQFELRQLSDFGLPLAKLKLADLYIKVGGEEGRLLAENLYKDIVHLDPRAYARLAKLYRRKVSDGQSEYFSKSVSLFEKSSELGDEASLKNLIDLYLSNPQYLSQEVPIKRWIDARASNGDVGANYDLARLYQLDQDGLNKSQEIISLCTPLVPSVPGCFDVLARLYRAMNDDTALHTLNSDLVTAYSEKSVTSWFVYQYAIELTKGDKPFVELAMTLHSEVAAEYPKAYMAMARLIVRNKQLGTKDELLALVAERAQAGVPEAHYLLGRLYFHGDWVVQDPYKAVEHLVLVKKEFPGAMFLIGLMHKEGHLGQPNFGLALEHFLSAARAGSTSADRELAEMYWYQKGVKRNIIYAYSFSLLAAGEGSEGARSLLEVIKQEMTVGQRMKADALIMRENKVRKESFAEKRELEKQGQKSQLVAQ